MENSKLFSNVNAEAEKLMQLNNENVIRVAEAIKNKSEEIAKNLEELQKKNQTLRIGVVGQVKAGKSSFLNSLFFNGENVLPRASTPMTAGLTVLKYGEENKFDIEYYNTEEWKAFEDKAKFYDDVIAETRKNNPDINSDAAAEELSGLDMEIKSAKELVQNCSRNALNNIQKISKITTQSFKNVKDLQNILEDYVGASGRYTSIVKSLTIHLSDERLKDIQIVDTPGVNDPIVSREQKTREFLRACHGVFFLSYSGRFFDSTDVSFLTDRIGSQGIGTVVLIASKFDSVLQDVGMKFHDDLGNAIDDCEKQLRKQYRTNISSSDFKGEDPIFNMSSGIGYSIYKKKPEDWDEMEQHVVNRMKDLYPSFFKTNEEIKNTFKDLANIDTMQESYIEKVFKNNKDKIIREKTSAYTANSIMLLKKTVTEKKKELVVFCNSLQESELSQMKDKEKSFNKAIKSIKDNIDTIAIKIGNEIDSNVKRCINCLKFSSMNIYTKQEDKSVMRKSTFWGSDKYFYCTYTAVDVHKTIDKDVDSISTQIKSMSGEWDKAMNSIRNTITDELLKIIAQQEDNEIELDGGILRNIVGNTVSEMENNTILSIENFLIDCKAKIENTLQTYNVCYNISAEEESVARRKYLDAAETALRKIRTKHTQLMSSLLKDVEDMLNEVGENAKEILTARRQQLTDNLTSCINKYLENLSKELTNKEKQLAIYNEAINGINNMEKIL